MEQIICVLCRCWGTLELAKSLNKRLVQRALAMEGTCTGEHGIGLGKQGCLREELGEAVDVMRDIMRLGEPQKLNKVRNLIQSLRRDKRIRNAGSRGTPVWVLAQSGPLSGGSTGLDRQRGDVRC